MNKKLSLFIAWIFLFPIKNDATSNPAVHIFGDSHSGVFNGIPLCFLHTTNSITMHRVGRDGLKFIDFRKFNIKEGDAIVYTFGEVDVRCHIGKQRDLQNRKQDEIINILVNNYIQSIATNAAFFKKVYPIVYLVVPPANHGFDNSKLPRYGSIEDRVAITKQLNATLKKACNTYGYHYIDIYNDYANELGYIRPEISDGNVHIRKDCNAAIARELKKILETIYHQSFDELFTIYRNRLSKHTTWCPICISYGQ